jgi:hypothetical protein
MVVLFYSEEDKKEDGSFPSAMSDVLSDVVTVNVLLPLGCIHYVAYPCMLYRATVR